MNDRCQQRSTCACNPRAPCATLRRQRAVSKGTELKDAGATLELLPMVSASQQYRPSSFWAELLELDASTGTDVEAGGDGDVSNMQLQRGQLSVSDLLLPHGANHQTVLAIAIMA